MINDDLLKLTGQLQNAVEKQKDLAKKSLDNLPEGQTKTGLEKLLKKASSGKVAFSDVQRELEKIVNNAS